jgi:hypothetical protein
MVSNSDANAETPRPTANIPVSSRRRVGLCSIIRRAKGSQAGQTTSAMARNADTANL